MLRQSDIAGVVYSQRMTHEQEAALPLLEALHGEVYLAMSNFSPNIRAITDDGHVFFIHPDGTYSG
jgi:hypothetical protein